MAAGDVEAVVLPVYNSPECPYLDTLVHRRDTFTTFTWGWQGAGSRMARPREILVREQTHLPFLFSETGQDQKAVTHAAVSRFIAHVGDALPADLSAWLVAHLVERFALDREDSALGGTSVYVLTACQMLRVPIPYERLRLLSEDRGLDPNKQRGYSIVRLPPELSEWFASASLNWDRYCALLPEGVRTGMAQL